MLRRCENTENKLNTVKIRLDSLILMTVFAVASFALMWTAVSCFNRIRAAYESSSECLGAARFTANHLRSAQGNISIYTDENGLLDRIVIARNDGYDNVITLYGGFLWEAVVRKDVAGSPGESIFSADRVYIYDSGTGTVKITVCSASGQETTIFAQPSAETGFYISKGGSGA